jgi:hypothetical protein
MLTVAYHAQNQLFYGLALHFTDTIGPPSSEHYVISYSDGPEKTTRPLSYILELQEISHHSGYMVHKIMFHKAKYRFSVTKQNRLRTPNYNHHKVRQQFFFSVHWSMKNLGPPKWLPNHTYCIFLVNMKTLLEFINRCLEKVPLKSTNYIHLVHSSVPWSVGNIAKLIILIQIDIGITHLHSILSHLSDFRSF